MVAKPEVKTRNPNFSSGPCAKRPGWNPDIFKNAPVGRSHRSKEVKEKIFEMTKRIKRLLELPEDYRVGLVAGSDTGAMELCMWTMLGPRPIDVFGFESFSKGWIKDIVEQLRLPDVNRYTADYGKLPDLSKSNPKHDIVFTLNGTTSGVKIPNLEWISNDREGVVICDATSGIFAMEIDYKKLDAITFSWQKVLGGEAAHGIVILSPRGIKRIEENEPNVKWPLPKIFRLYGEGKLKPKELESSPINTPSILCIVDVIDALEWAESIGGLKALIGRSQENLAVLERWVEKSDWIDFLADLLLEGF